MLCRFARLIYDEENLTVLRDKLIIFYLGREQPYRVAVILCVFLTFRLFYGETARGIFFTYMLTRTVPILKLLASWFVETYYDVCMIHFYTIFKVIFTMV